MSARINIEASNREGTGKGIARALRRGGRVPAVIYGDNQEPVIISIETKEVTKEYQKGHLFTTVCDMEIDGKKHVVLARDAHLHPVKDTIMHVDFLRVTKKTKIPVNVSVTFLNEGDAPGIKAGGILSVVRHEVEVFCSALEIPDLIEADLAELEIGDSIKSTDIKLPSGVEFTINDREFTVASIVAKKAAVVEEEDEEETVAAGDVPATEVSDGDSADEGKSEE